jgi:hypothetical protein
MTPIDSTATPRVESAEWITGLGSVSCRSVKRVLVFEDSYLVRGIEVVKGWYVQRREKMESGESQCAEKFFCLRLAPGRGVGNEQNSKIKNQKSRNRKNRKSEFLAFAEKEENAKNPRIARAVLNAIGQGKSRFFAWWLFNTALDRIKI